MKLPFVKRSTYEHAQKCIERLEKQLEPYRLKERSKVLNDWQKGDDLRRPIFYGLEMPTGWGKAEYLGKSESDEYCVLMNGELLRLSSKSLLEWQNTSLKQRQKNKSIDQALKEIAEYES